MGCTTSTGRENTSNITSEALKQLSLTPLGYTLPVEEIKQLSTDGKLLSCGPNDIIYDKATAYHPQDKSLVVCMYYFGILCYGVAEVQSFDRTFTKTNYMVGPGSILLGEHLFDRGKRHSLNRGYNIVAKTQCTVLLVNLQTFERYSKSISPSRIDWWNSLCTEPAGNILSTIFPGIQSHVRNELMTRINWRALEAGEELSTAPPFDPHAASLKLPTNPMGPGVGGHGDLSQRPPITTPDGNTQNGNIKAGTNVGKPNPTIPFQLQPQNDPLGPRSIFILVKGKLRKYPKYLPPDPAAAHHKEILLSTTAAGQLDATQRIHNDPFDAEYDYEPVERFGDEDNLAIHRRLRPRLELYCKTHALSQVNNGYIHPGEPVFEFMMFEQAEFLLAPFVVAQERSLVVEIPYHVYQSFKTQSYFLPMYQCIQAMLTNAVAHLVMNTEIDFFKVDTPSATAQGGAGGIPNLNTSAHLIGNGTNTNGSGGATGGDDKAGINATVAAESPVVSPAAPVVPPRTRRPGGGIGGGGDNDTDPNNQGGNNSNYRTLNLRGQNALQLAQQYHQQQMDFYSGLIDKAELFIVKPGTIIQEPNRTAIDRLIIILHGNILIQDPEALEMNQILYDAPAGPLTNNLNTTTKGFNIVARAGDYLNELGLVTSYSRPYGIRTLTNCIYLTLTRTSFERLISNRDVSFFCIRLGRSQAPLEAILSHPQTSDSFYKLAQSEHSTENLDFYKRILEFRSRFEGVTRTEVKVIRDAAGRSVAALSYPYLYTELLEIYNSYIRPDHAHSQVNLPHHVVDQVRESLFDDETQGVGPDGLIENLTHRSLDHALAEVILLMRRDIFTRYVVHESYLDLLKQFKPYANQWKDDKEKDKIKWAQRMKLIRPDAPADFPEKIATPIEQQDLVKFEKCLEETGLGIGNFFNLPGGNLE